MVFETDGSSKIWYYYNASGAPVAFRISSVLYIYRKNLQGDITGQGVLGNNMFAYCNNNPVANIDESGAFLSSILKVVIGVAVVAAAAIVTVANAGAAAGTVAAAVHCVAAGAMTGAATGAVPVLLRAQ